MENISKSSNIEATRTHSTELDSCVVYNSECGANNEVIKVFFFSAISLLFFARQHIFPVPFSYQTRRSRRRRIYTHTHLTHNRKSIYQINEKMVGHSLLLAKVRLSPILIASLSEIYQNTSETMCACNGESRMDDNGIRLHFNQFHSRVLPMVKLCSFFSFSLSAILDSASTLLQFANGSNIVSPVIHPVTKSKNRLLNLEQREVSMKAHKHSHVPTPTKPPSNPSEWLHEKLFLSLALLRWTNVRTVHD